MQFKSSQTFQPANFKGIKVGMVPKARLELAQAFAH
jgi:hypothetical protein